MIPRGPSPWGTLSPVGRSPHAGTLDVFIDTSAWPWRGAEFPSPAFVLASLQVPSCGLSHRSPELPGMGVGRREEK